MLYVCVCVLRRPGRTQHPVLLDRWHGGPVSGSDHRFEAFLEAGKEFPEHRPLVDQPVEWIVDVGQREPRHLELVLEVLRVVLRDGNGEELHDGLLVLRAFVVVVQLVFLVVLLRQFFEERQGRLAGPAIGSVEDHRRVDGLLPGFSQERLDRVDVLDFLHDPGGLSLF